MTFVQKLTFWCKVVLFSIFAAFCVSPSAFSVSNISWLLEGDLAQTLIGWEFYRVSPVLDPITRIGNMFPDTGFYILQTDTMPWISIITKSIVHFFDITSPFHFIGLWLIFCWIMQGLCAGLIGRSLNLNRESLWLLIFLFIFSPILLFRVGHFSLMAHWIILVVIYEVIRLNLGETISKPRILYLVSIVAFSLGIHPYLFAISAPILILLIIFNPSHWLKKILSCSFLFLLVYASTHILGVNSIKHPKASDFGACNTDLLGFFNSFGASLFVPKLRHFWCQMEGFTYFGLGFLILLFILRKPLKSLIYHGWNSSPMKYFLLLCGLYILYSLASPIRFGGNPIIYLPIYDLIEPLPSYFRSSGRWIWPFFYVVLISGVVVLDRSTIRFKKIVISLIAILHFIEFTPLMRVFKPPPQSELELEKLIQALPRPTMADKKMQIYPNVVSVGCGIDDHKWNHRTYFLVMIALARTGWQVDSGLGGRFDPSLVEQCIENNKKGPSQVFPLITQTIPSQGVKVLKIFPDLYIIKDNY